MQENGGRSNPVNTRRESVIGVARVPAVLGLGGRTRQKTRMFPRMAWTRTQSPEISQAVERAGDRCKPAFGLVSSCCNPASGLCEAAVWGGTCRSLKSLRRLWVSLRSSDSSVVMRVCSASQLPCDDGEQGQPPNTE